MAYRDARRLYAGPRDDAGARDAAEQTQTTRCVFPPDTFYNPPRGVAFPAPSTHEPPRAHDAPAARDEADRLCQIRELLAEMRSSEEPPSGGEDEDDDDAPDDVAYPDEETDDGFAAPPEPDRGAAAPADADGLTAQDLERLDREAARAIRRGCKPPSEVARVVAGLGFTIHRALTPGSEGCVFESSHHDYPQRVVVKAGWYASSVHEARLLRRLSHPGVLTLLDVRAVAGLTCLVVPKYRADLYTYLGSRAHPLGHAQVTALARQLLGAIDYIHGEGIIHRDIKTENVLINGPEDICLGDFGAACFARGSWSTPVYYGIAGTVDTNAPEVLAGDPYTPSVDIWSAGLVIFEAAVHTASLFSTSQTDERRPYDTQILRIIQQAQVHVDEFPQRAGSRLVSQYRHRAARNRRPAHTRPAWTRYYKLNLDVEYLVCRALTFDGSRRPSAAELLRLPLFQSS
ncbi:serine/threonine protein kinase US3 [Macacine alphaherpesvirus 3]|uniref:non-specific serine/threonine protein kinase n=1 Tax=Macacine alphaherpesvirus 3 TaxID=2845555 RepID=A0A1X9WFE4_9ALPH|nr:serine/threonine protein kinase US3 [Macacine alphaherpesvirus 1]ARS01849.1 serine/threonine protein kinase US3 [Macacine alphaherpesvirus 3]